MERDKQCNYLKCPNSKKTTRGNPVGFDRNNIFTCRCCNKAFCSDSCLVEHLILLEKEKKQNFKDHTGLKEKEYDELAVSRSLFMKPGQILKERDKNPYYDFSNFEKVKVGNKLKNLGNGAFGEVFLARNTIDSKHFAVKQINKAKLDSVSIKPELIYREINVHMKLVHDHIARLYNYHEDNKCFYLIIEYAEKETLFKLIQNSDGMGEEDAFKYFIQVASAINFLHENNMIHRDLKPENILISKDGNVKLCDFGWTVETSKTRETFCGTYEYMAPEIIVEKPYNKAIDIWSLGILLYELLHSYSPFRAQSSHQGKTENASYKEVMKNVINYKFTIDKQISEECRDMLVKLLHPKMENRMSISEVFSHPWIKKFETRLKGSMNQLNKLNQLDLVKKEMNKFNTYQVEKKNVLNKSVDSVQGNVTVIDSLQIAQKDNTLFDNVLEKVQGKSKLKRKSSSYKVDKSTFKPNRNKIVLRVEKPHKEDLSPREKENKNPKEQTQTNCFDNTVGQLAFGESPIRKHQQSIYNDSCFSMYKEMKEIDREIDKKLQENHKEFEHFKKRNEKMKEQMLQSSVCNYNKNESVFNFKNDQEEGLLPDTSFNNKQKFDSSSKLFENLKTQSQSLLYQSNIAETAEKTEKTNYEKNDKIMMNSEKKVFTPNGNYNDLMYCNLAPRSSNPKMKKASQSKKTLKQINKDLENINNKKLNYSDVLNFEESILSNFNPMDMDQKPRYHLNNKSEMSIQTDTPVPPKSIWSRFAGLFGAFKCGS